MSLAFSICQVDAPGRTPGVRWIAELVDSTGYCTVPYAVAWVTDCRPVLGMSLDYVFVPPHARRRGCATALIQACAAHWPDLILTNAIAPEGEALMASLVARGIIAEE